MLKLKAYLATELPRINKTLDAEVAVLHPLVRPVAEHVLRAGGKRLRPLLTLLTARTLRTGGAEGGGLFRTGSGPDLYPLACSVELLHSATLLHDDILDGADLRRGLPAAHTVFGQTETVLAGDALLALANRIVARYGDTRLTETIAEAIVQTATGEIVEIAHQRSTDHGHDTYIDIITGKTAWMLRASCELGALAAQAPDEAVQAAAGFGLNLGIAFQIVDDALDFAASSKDTGKPVGGDLREGKLTPPLIYYLETLAQPERDAFVTRFRQGSFDDAAVAEVAADLRARGCDAKTRELAASYLDKASACLDALPDTSERRILRQSIDYVLNRGT
ncbi:polyprenyl synthetase family protein [Nitratidesulfovibrio sp.]|uniref:polyprenyl synthetase family protein n=1 Tax=Nitratidesulfovibrio sp. TaxID=2802297 RepID=UPI0033423C04